LFCALGDRFPQADVLIHLGDAYEAAGETENARDARWRALDILTELGHSLGDRLREKLRSEGSSATSLASEAC